MSDKLLMRLSFLVVVFEAHYAGVLTEWLGWYYITGVVVWALVKGTFFIDINREFDKHIKIKGIPLYTYGYNIPKPALFIGLGLMALVMIRYKDTVPVGAVVGIANTSLLVVTIVSTLYTAFRIKRTLSNKD